MTLTQENLFLIFLLICCVGIAVLSLISLYFTLRYKIGVAHGIQTYHDIPLKKDIPNKKKEIIR